ncbi:MAG: site-specific tyrosine recombinase/integron integrase [Rikenellaceae bacterium]
MEGSTTQWQNLARQYITYIRLERSLAKNSVDAYSRDLGHFSAFVLAEYNLIPQAVKKEQIEAYMEQLHDIGLLPATAMRMLSGVKSFYNFLILQNEIERSPAEFVIAPKAERHLPEMLTIEEIDKMIELTDSETPKGVRDRAIIEMLYSCGLRVSELTTLKIGDLFLAEGYIRVIGKGSKQRLVPISMTAKQRLEEYLVLRKNPQSIEPTIFLNNRGKPLTRVMIFTIVKQTAIRAGVKSPVSPHTLRHSFATHLLEGGASIRQVQEMLGHKNITTTEIYTHLSTKHLRDTLRRYLPM